MKTISYKEIETSTNPHSVETKKIHDNENVRVVHMLLKPGESLKKHTTPVV
jgi:quercetin dioxygenase-like cupin family protein